ncbi:MAG: PAS domain-containing protein [bacterium]
MRELQLRFMAPIVGLVLLLVVVSGLVFILRSREAVVEAVREEQLAVARAGAHGVGAFVGVVANEMDRIARKDAVQRGAAAQPLLKGEAKASAVFTGFHLFGKRGNLMATSGMPSKKAVLVPEDPCFERVLSGSVFCLGAVRDADSDTSVAYAMSPVVDDLGETRSVFVGGVKMGPGVVADMVSGVQAGRKGFAFLVDCEGNLVWTGDTGADAAGDAQAVDYSSLQPVLEAREGRRGSVDYRYGKTPVIASFYPVPSTEWVFVVQRPAREVSGGAGYAPLLLFILLGALGAVVVAVALSQTFSRFVFSLAGRMDAVARGDMGQRIEADENRELAPIARSFNRMLESIRTGQQGREDSYRELLGTARFHQSLVDSIRDFFVVVDSGMRVLHLSESARGFCPPSRAAMGEQLQSLGSSWSRQKFIDAVRQVIIEGAEREIDSMGFMRGGSGEAALFRLHIQPMSASDSGRREGALISGMEITREARLFREQEHSGRFYRTLTEDLPVAIVLVDEGMKVEWWNPAAAELLGFKPDSVGAEFAGLLAARSRGLFAENFKRTLNDGTALPAWEMEVPGGERPVHIETQMARVVISGGRARIAMYMRKMPHRRRLEKEAYEGRPALEKKLQYYRGMIEGIGAPVAVVDKRGAMVAVNNHFEGLVRNTRQILMGKSFIEQFRNGPARLYPGAVIDSGAPAEGEALFGSGPEELQLLLHAEPLRTAESGIDGVVYLVREIGGARKEQEQRIYETRTSAVRDTARHIVKRVEPAVSSLQESLHELGRNVFSAENRRVWRKAASSLRLVMNSLNNLRLFTSEPKPKYEACRIGELLDGVLMAAAEVEMIPPEVSIEREFEEDLPEVRADAEQIKMVVWQLLLNALQAVGEEGGEILIRAVARDISGDSAVLVEVWNGGEKVDEKEITRVFDPFRGSTRGGMGLGLALCRRVVQSHGGRIGLEREDEFTRVSFYLPAGKN